MAGTDDLRNMVMTFRVSELQMLLGFAGRNKTGRKNELQGRAQELLRLKSAPIQMKIRELYKSIQQGVAQGQQVGEAGAPPTSASQAQAAMMSQQQQMAHKNTMMGGHPPGSNYLPQYQTQQGRPAMYPYYQGKAHTPPLGDSLGAAARGTMPNNIPVHPDVQLKRLPFFEHISDLLKPSTLMPTGTARIQEQTFVFHLTPAQANEIAFNRDVGSSKSDYIVQDDYEDRKEFSPFTNQAVEGSRKRKCSLSEGGNVEVQMRFCLLETSCEQDDFFPPGIIVKVNSKPCPLPNPIPTNRPGVEPKRPPRPVNISHLVRISPTVANTITVSWAAEFGRGYVIAINLVKKLTSTQLLHRLKTRGVRHADYTTALIKEKLTEDADSEIATTSLRVSLMCPLGKMRMSLPCRPTTCTHLQCFDANLYLQMNERKPTWTCPVCDKPGLFDKLVIDGYFQEVLGSAKLPQDTNEIQLLQDGTWSISVVKKEEKTDSASPPPVKNRGGPPVVAATVEIADDEVFSVDVGSDSEEKKEDVKVTNEPALKAAKVVSVDLTLSDDDDVTPTPVASSNGPDSSKAAVEDSSSSKTASTAVTPGYISPNIITLDSPSPPSSPGPPNLSLPPITYPPAQSLPPFFDMENYPPLSPSN